MFKKVFVTAILLSFVLVGTALAKAPWEYFKINKPSQLVQPATTTSNLAKAPWEYFKIIIPSQLVKPSATTSNTSGPDLTCMVNAIETRETVIIAAWEKYTAAIKTALETRKSSLKDAWGQTDKQKRREGRNNAWNEYKKARIAARKEFEKERRAAWLQFVKDRKACRGQWEDTSNESKDTAL